MKPTFTVRRGDEVEVYVLGRLVMKRWLSQNLSVTFHVAPSGTRWSPEAPPKNKAKET
jgi:hypothetical protein